MYSMFHASAMAELILVSNRLPIRINESGDVERTTGGLASALEGAGIKGDSAWIGWGGVETIARDACENGTVWIHDYHLFLLPKMLRERRPDLKIGFFLHTPFPSSEIFRVLPDRQEILEGLLGCDQIGFHTYNYLRHFRSSLLRVLGTEDDPDGIWYGNRFVNYGVYPIGHNRMGFQKAMESEKYKEALQEHSERLGDGKLLLSVERLDYTKGVPQKLEAIRRFLEANPDERSKVNFVIIAVPSRVGVEEYDELTETVQREVGAINGDFGEVGHSPVQFLHRGFPMEELAAFYALADVCMVTPIVDGMNLVAKEYIDCKRKQLGARAGVLILSEFAGAAQEMSHALLVNPHDTHGVARTVKNALAMSDEDMWDRVRAMQARLSRNDAGAWAKLFLDDLSKAGVSDTNAEAHETLDEVGEDIKDRIEFGEHPNVRIAVISGRPKDFLELHFGHLNIDLVAEHGYFWRRYKNGENREWEVLDQRADNLEWAVTLTPGSEIEEKRSSVVWHYRRADPEFALWRAKGLLSELTSTTASLPVSVHHGQKIVEVASQMVNKGVAAEML